MRIRLQQIGDWNKVMSGFKSLSPQYEIARKAITLRVAERYVEVVKQEMVKRGAVMELSSLPEDQKNRRDLSDSVLLTFIKVSIEDGQVFAGIDREQYVGSFNVLDFFFKKEFGIYGPAGAGVWRRAYVILKKETEKIVSEELAKLQF